MPLKTQEHRRNQHKWINIVSSFQRARHARSVHHLPTESSNVFRNFPCKSCHVRQLCGASNTISFFLCLFHRTHTIPIVVPEFFIALEFSVNKRTQWNLQRLHHRRRNRLRRLIRVRLSRSERRMRSSWHKATQKPSELESTCVWVCFCCSWASRSTICFLTLCGRTYGSL